MSELLDFKAKVDFTQAKKDIADFEKMLAKVGVAPASPMTASNTQAISGYRQAQLALQETLRNARLETEKLKQSAQQYRTEVEQGKVAQQSAKTATEQLRISEQGLRNAYAAGRITQQQYDQQLVQTRIDLQQQNAALVQSRTNTENARTALVQLNLQQKQLALETKAARAAQVAANGSYKEAQARLKQLGDQIRSVEGGFSGLGKIQQARIAEYNKLNKSIGEFDRRMGNHRDNVGNYSSALRGVTGQLAGFASTFLSAAAAISAANATFNQALKSDAVRTSLQFTFGSVDLADAKLEQLLKTANRLGVNYNALTSSYKSFTGAVIASNFEFKEGERIFNAVAGASSKLKLSSEDTEGALRALQQMISKGNVQAEELRGQLGERIPGAFSIAARAMGVTETELNKLLQKGEVLAADLLPKLSIELEKTFGLGTTQQVEGLTAEVERFKNIFSGLVSESSNTSNFFATVTKGFNEIAGMLADLVNSGSWNEFWVRMLSGKESGDAIKGMASSIEQSQKAIQNSLSLNKGSDSKDLTLGYEQLTIALKNATEARDLFAKKVSEGYIRDKGGDLVRLNNDIELLTSKMKQVKPLIPEVATVSAGETASDKAARLKAEREVKAAVKAQRSLQSEIDEINAKARRKQLDNDAEEIANVEAKYKKLREKAIAFNNDPLNKKKGLKVDSGGLVVAQNEEVDALRDKQAAAKLKISLDEQKQLYNEFESYKDKVGKENAEKRYASLIDTDRTYLEKLELQKASIANLQKGEGGNQDAIKASEERLKVIDKEITAETLLQQKKQEQLLAEFISYADERKALTEKFEADLLIIGDNQGSKEKRTKRYNEELKELDFANLKKLESYEELFKGIDKLSERSALKQLEFARRKLDKDIMSGAIVDPQEIAKIKAYFNQIEHTIREGSGKALKDLGAEIVNVANEVGNLNEAFGKMLATIGNVVGQVGNIKAGLKDFNIAKGAGDSLGQLTAGLGIVGAGISIFSSVFKLFDRSQQREAQAAYSRDLQNKQTEALNKALERQVSLLDKAYGTERITKYSEAIKQAEDNEKKYQEQLAGRLLLTGEDYIDKMIAKLNNGESLGTLNDKKFADALRKGGTILPTDIASLQALLEEGKLDASTTTIVQNLIKANETAEQLKNNLRAETVGAGLSTIVDEFVSALEGGAESFEDTLTKSIRRGLLNALKGDLTAKYIQDFYSQLDSALKDGEISTEEDKALKDLYKAAEEYGKKKLEYIDSVAPGDSKTSNEALKPNTLTAALNQPTGERLEGLWRGNFDLTKQLVTQGQATGLTMGEMYRSGLDRLAALERIAVSTEATAGHTARLEKIENSLVAIEANTKQVKSARD